MKRAIVLSLFAFWMAVGGPAFGAPIRILIAAGAKTGLESDRPLVHPADDAQGVRDVMTSLGFVANENVIFLPDATKAGIDEALMHAAALARGHDPAEVTLIVYFSGHGDQDALHMRGELVRTDQLSARIDHFPAALRLVVVDACRTPQNSREKGMNSSPGFAVTLSPGAGAKGTATLYASADGEAAQESDDIGGAVFTHFWLAGLRGAADVNGDRRVTLDESFAYAYSQTLVRSARSGGVLQRPEAKLELSESSPLVLTELTELSGARALLEFPTGGEALYLVYSVGAMSVMAEVVGLPERAVQIVLPAGRYVIQKRDGANGAAVEVSLGAGSTRVLNPGEFRPFPIEALAQKGGLIVRPWSVELAGSVLSGREIGLQDEVALHLSRRGVWGVSAGPFGSTSVWRSPANRVTERALGAEAMVDRYVPVMPELLFRAGAEVRVEWVSQTVTRNDAFQVALGGYPGSTHATPMVVGGGLHVGGRWAFSKSLYLDIAARGLVTGAKSATGLDVRPLGGGFVALGTAL